MAALPSGICHSTATSVTGKANLPCACGKSTYNPATSSYLHSTAHRACKTCSVVGLISRSAAFSRWGQGSSGEAGGKADKKKNTCSCPPSPKSACSTLSLRAQLHLSPGVFPLTQAARELHVQKFFSDCITWLLKDIASPSQPLAQADLGYYRRGCTLPMNQGRELSK